MIEAALHAMLATPELTHPVTLGAASTRGIVDAAGQMVPVAGTEVQRIGTVLYVAKDSLPGLAQGAVLTVGALGAASAVGGRSYRAGAPEPIDDGLLIAVELGGGR